MAAKQNKEEKQAFEPIFMGYNENAKNELLYQIKRVFEEAQAIKAKLDEKGIRVTKNILENCFFMSKEEVEIGEGFRGVKTIYHNTEHLDEEFSRMLKEETESIKAKIIRDNITESMKQAETAFKDDVLRLRRGFDETRFNISENLKWLIISENGEISLPSDLEEQAAKVSGYWIKTESQKAAFDAHKNAAQALTEFLKYFPKDVWPQTLAQIGNLFEPQQEETAEGGTQSVGFKPRFIDYSYFIR